MTKVTQPETPLTPLAKLQVELADYLKTVDPALIGTTKILSVSSLPLEGGQHNVTYLVRINGKQRFVARFHPKTVRADGNDPTADEFHKLAQTRGLHAPKAIALLKPDFLSSSLLLMEFIEGTHKDFSVLSDSEISNFARAVADIHTITREHTFSSNPDLPQDVSGSRLDYIRTIIDTTILARLRSANPSVYAKDRSWIERAQHVLAARIDQHKNAFSGATFSYLHNDIVILNVLWNKGQPTLIDWEVPSFGDPADEVAYIFAINNTSKRFQQVFFDTYEQYIHDATFAERIDIYMLKNRLCDVAWAISMLEEKRTDSNPLMQKKLCFIRGILCRTTDKSQAITG